MVFLVVIIQFLCLIAIYFAGSLRERNLSKGLMIYVLSIGCFVAISFANDLYFIELGRAEAETKCLTAEAEVTSPKSRAKGY